MNWVHVENLVQAQILAAEALTPEKNYIAVSKQCKHHSFHLAVDPATVSCTAVTTVAILWSFSLFVSIF